jgi:Caspase domain
MSEKKYAVLIGNGEFPQDPKVLPTLRCSVNDATAFNDVLRSPTYGLFDETVVLADKRHHEILLELNKVLKRAEKNDLVLIYYSGHGKLNTTGILHLATLDTQVGYIEATSVSVVRIRELMDTCPSKKMILILDCCYSGRVAGAYLKGNVEDHLQQVAGGNDSRGIYLLTASTGVQVAQEKEGDENSLLTKYLLEGIREAKADFDDDGLVTISDLFKYVSDTISLESSQVPTKTDLNVQGDSLVVAKTGRGQGVQREAELVQLLYQRRRLRDRSIIGGLAIGGAVGGGMAVLLVRLFVSLPFGPDRFLPTSLFNYVLTAAALSGALSLGMAFAAQLWRTGDSSSEQNILMRWARYLRNRSNLALLFGTIGFAIAYLFFALLNNPNPKVDAAITNGIFGTIAGLGLGLAAYGLPTTSARLSVRSWLLRIASTGIIYALIALPAALGKIPILLNLAWGKDAFARAFAQSIWSQSRTITSDVVTYLAVADAFVVGCGIAAGTTLGLTKAANALARLVKNVQPERE